MVNNDMCKDSYKKNKIEFYNIDNTSFNKYEEAMDYITHSRGEKETAQAAIYMLNKQIAQIFKTCPAKVMDAIKESVDQLES